MGDLSSVKSEFPALSQSIYGKPFVYLDTAATALKPKPVIEAIQHFYAYEASNVHRGAHYLSSQATEKFEGSRQKVAKFIGASSADEIIFTKGTTESINLVARSWGHENLKDGDEILLTMMEHHSNIVPWQLLASEKNLVLKFAPLLPNGDLDLIAFEKLISNKTRLVAITHASNVLGTVNPIDRIVDISHRHGAKVLVDAAQSVTFLSLNVQKMKCDFLVFSAHKIYGPYGVGILYAPKSILNSMAPYQGGGSMIESVTVEGSRFLKAPHRFEAGTPNISGVIATGTAIDFIKEIGAEYIYKHEMNLLGFLRSKLQQLGGIDFIGESSSAVNICSFNIRGCHASDVGQIIDQLGVAVRAGHHCAQPLMRFYGVSATVRASLGVYNSEEDVDILIQALIKAKGMLL